SIKYLYCYIYFSSNFAASRSASAVCLASCNYTRPCSEVYSCQIDICPNLTEEDLRDNCKCYVKCRQEFEDLNKRKDNCLLLQRLKTCFEDGGCDVSNVPQLQKFAKECNNCEPKQCKEEACVGRLDCLTNSTRGGCTTAASVQSVMNTTSETMHNAWFLPEKCGKYYLTEMSV
ncbi:uncharacterized protein LOC115232232, partial [Octopus sinensis]|uniref:Uncharacterized protein LOC115232232 n=1 Tax=Octopus sinensis TaxID=2607531 RepID=A0A6P7U994_9MOLL